VLTVADAANPENFVMFAILAPVDDTGYTKLPLQFLMGNGGTVAAGDVIVSFDYLQGGFSAWPTDDDPDDDLQGVVEGFLWHDTATDELKMRNAADDGWVTVGSGGAVDLLEIDVAQSGHGLAVGEVIRRSTAGGGSYVKAQADSAANAEAVGIVTAVPDTDNFTYSPGGHISGLSGLTNATVYFLSPSSAGALTATEPSTDGQVSKPLLIATSTTTGVFFNMRGAIVDGGDEQNQFHLLNYLIAS
jgi:hypothetical protein